MISFWMWTPTDRCVRRPNRAIRVFTQFNPDVACGVGREWKLMATGGMAIVPPKKRETPGNDSGV